jgi:hypothetical protein
MMFGSQQTTLHKLAPETYAGMKCSGRFFVNVSTYNNSLDVSQHVAAQNAMGWRLENEQYVPVGNSPSAVILRNVGFTLSKEEVVPQ